jgi:hypothetical protein
MHSTLSTAPGRLDHPPQPTRSYQARRVNLLDRIALRIGIALITWGRRPRSIESRERRANRIEQQLGRLERERAAERRLRLTLPVR